MISAKDMFEITKENIKAKAELVAVDILNSASESIDYSYTIDLKHISIEVSEKLHDILENIGYSVEWDGCVLTINWAHEGKK